MEAQGNCPKRFKLSIEWGVYYYKKERARQHPMACRALCGLCQSDIDCNLTPGHDTEQRDSKHKMILIPSSSARLGHTHHETHNVSVKVCLREVFREVGPLAEEAVGPR